MNFRSRTSNRTGPGIPRPESLKIAFLGQESKWCCPPVVFGSRFTRRYYFERFELQTVFIGAKRSKALVIIKRKELAGRF